MEKKDINENTTPEVFKIYDDGYIVRSMTLCDAKIVQEWFGDMGPISPYDLNIALKIFPPGRGFYIGEYQGVVVSSCVRLPWGNAVYYGSYYYVHKDYRGRGFGTRLRDQVAYGHVIENNGVLCVDAVLGSVAKKNAAKFGYVTAFVTRRYCGEAKHFNVTYDGRIVEAKSVAFDELISYDNKNFVCKDCPRRRRLLQEMINIPDGAAVVALNDRDQIVGFGLRRPNVKSQTNNHMLGPLYADNTNIAMAILQQLGQNVIGSCLCINIWTPNEEGVKAIESLGFEKMFDVIRMHANGNPNEFKATVYGLTNIDTCGF